ncbi:MAG: glycosyltransferase [Clostridia bacterium]|nr:glycosyltransferase [Clostridia bacterium]
MKVLKIAALLWKNASRDKRELGVARDLGAEVAVMARSETVYEEDMVDGFKVYRYPTRPFGSSRIMYPIGRVFSFFQWAPYARKLEADVISGHDLPGLGIAWLSTLFMPKKRRPLLVYDSHEFEIGRAADRTRLQSWLVLHTERFLARRSAFTIVFSDFVADEDQRIHKLKERPVVARNIPAYHPLDDAALAAVRERRSEMCRLLGVPEDTFIASYHGAITPVRGIDTAIEAISKCENTALFVIGDGPESFISQMKALAAELGVADRVYFHEAVPLDELWSYIGAADVGLVTVPPVSESYYHMLPNKFFENIQALTPVICSDFPDIRKVMDSYGIGLAADPTNAASIASAIEAMRLNPELYASFEKGLLAAKENLCWEHE